MHGNFLLPANASVPLIYVVDLLRSGQSYSTRYVTVRQSHAASQNSNDPGDIVYVCLCSFQKSEKGVLEHQPQYPHYFDTLSNVPESHPLVQDVDVPWWEEYAKKTGHISQYQGVEVRKVNMVDWNAQKPLHKRRQLHLYKFVGSIPEEDINLHLCGHLYASDRSSLLTLINAAGVSDRIAHLATITHTVIFHRDARKTASFSQCQPFSTEGESKNDGWFLLESFNDRTGGGRGFYRARIWDMKSLVLVASIMQDGVVRVKQDVKRLEKGYSTSGVKL
ncbi:thioesterase-like superfamily-domain-containing protein [Leptodontidium sp. MPI-SDFR-AT-0119]|nr:thioesterase-like superfamily-domain-containing protein [Leptodontidium sp. MPI-SDFR-AT-0119]